MTTNDRTIKLVLSYDGTDFAGWQRQEGQRSVQEELEKALAKMHGRPIGVTGAGRTDSGVHAAGQVAHFESDIASIPADRYALALNKLMPQDVRILSSSEAVPGFNARYDARLRRYKYYFYSSGRALPHRDRFAWRLPQAPNLRSLNRYAACLRGELDCTAFAAAKDPSENRYRYLHHACFYPEGDALVFDVAANAFLWRMVRSLVGTLMELERNDAPWSAMQDILESKDRSRAGATAPARGLFLWNVEYYDQPRHPFGVVPCEAKDYSASSDNSESAPHAGRTEGKRLVPGLGWL